MKIQTLLFCLLVLLTLNLFAEEGMYYKEILGRSLSHNAATPELMISDSDEEPIDIALTVLDSYLHQDEAASTKANKFIFKRKFQLVIRFNYFKMPKETQNKILDAGFVPTKKEPGSIELIIDGLTATEDATDTLTTTYNGKKYTLIYDPAAETIELTIFTPADPVIFKGYNLYTFSEKKFQAKITNLSNWYPQYASLYEIQEIPSAYW